MEEETLTSTVSAVKASIVLTTSDGQKVTIDLPVDSVFPTLVNFDVIPPTHDLYASRSELESYRFKKTLYRRMRLTLPMKEREDGTYYTVSYKDADD